MDEKSTYNRPSRYAMIPEWVIYHPDLTGSDVRVYAVMARMADAEGRCYPKADTVASRLGVSDDTVRRSSSTARSEWGHSSSHTACTRSTSASFTRPRRGG